MFLFLFLIIGLVLCFSISVIFSFSFICWKYSSVIILYIISSPGARRRFELFKLLVVSPVLRNWLFCRGNVGMGSANSLSWPASSRAFHFGEGDSIEFSKSSWQSVPFSNLRLWKSLRCLFVNGDPPRVAVSPPLSKWVAFWLARLVLLEMSCNCVSRSC